MNFAEWTEKNRKENKVSFLPEQENRSGEWSGQQRQTGGGSFGNCSRASRNGGRGGGATDAGGGTYSPIKGIAGGLQKGLTDIAKKGGAVFALAEDIQYAPLEVITGRKLGELSDNGPMNLWNDSIRRAAVAVEDYYAGNIAAGGTAAEIVDKAVSKAVSLAPSVAVDVFTHGAGTASELGNTVTNSLPGIGSSFRTATEKLVRDPQYWLSVAGTAGERYENARKGLEEADVGGWANAVGRSAGESLYKEAIGASEEVPGVVFALAEIAYEMYREKQTEKPEDSWLDELAKLLIS